MNCCFLLFIFEVLTEISLLDPFWDKNVSLNSPSVCVTVWMILSNSEQQRLLQGFKSQYILLNFYGLGIWLKIN
jgi:hypothetical protein